MNEKDKYLKMVALSRDLEVFSKDMMNLARMEVKRIEQLNTGEITPQVCEHGSLRRSCEICERDAEIVELNAAITNLHLAMTSAEQIGVSKAAEEVSTTKQQVEDLKCCGNCKLFLRGNCPQKEQVDEFQTEFPEPNSVCIAWSSDGKTMEGRQK
jgi:hypothetical protein